MAGSRGLVIRRALWAAVEAHVRETIDRIVELAPRMAVNIDVLMHRYGGVRPDKENKQ